MFSAGPEQQPLDQSDPRRTSTASARSDRSGPRRARTGSSGSERSPPDLRRELRIKVFPAGPQPGGGGRGEGSTLMKSVRSLDFIRVVPSSSSYQKDMPERCARNNVRIGTMADTYESIFVMAGVTRSKAIFQNAVHFANEYCFFLQRAISTNHCSNTYSINSWSASVFWRNDAFVTKPFMSIPNTYLREIRPFSQRTTNCMEERHIFLEYMEENKFSFQTNPVPCRGFVWKWWYTFWEEYYTLCMRILHRGMTQRNATLVESNGWWETCCCL